VEWEGGFGQGEESERNWRERVLRLRGATVGTENDDVIIMNLWNQSIPG